MKATAIRPRAIKCLQAGVLVCASSLAGCGVSATGLTPTAQTLPSVPSANAIAPPEDAGSGDRGTVSVHIAVPAPPLRSRFVSPSTRGMLVDFSLDGKVRVHRAFAVSEGARGCKAHGATILCKFVIPLRSGRFRASVATYDAAPVRGDIPPTANELASDPSIPVVVRARKNRAIRLVLSGIPAIVRVVPPDAIAGAAFPQPQPIALDVQDADGNTILGTYAAPVTMSDGDTTGATVVATQGSDSPSPLTLKSSSDTATLSYTGLAIGAVPIVATPANGKPGSGSFAPTLQPIVVTTSDTQNPNFIGLDFIDYGGGEGGTGTLTLSEAGWSNAPYDRTFTATPQSACASIATTTPPNGTAFTVTTVNAPHTVVRECSVTFTDGAGQSASALLTFSFFGSESSMQSIVVPPGVTSITFYAFGAPGGGSNGGGGGRITATIPVTPGETIYTVVAGAGGLGLTGGYNGGAAGGSATAGTGGDASDVRIGGTSLADRVIVAGGGGGSGNCGGNIGGGAGGGGTTGAGANGMTTLGGGGGTPNSGGTAGTFGGSVGALGAGGAGGGCGGGGGGGGYYGGGGGGGNAIGPASGGGGGGSSFVTPIATNVTDGQGSSGLGVYGYGVVDMAW